MFKKIFRYFQNDVNRRIDQCDEFLDRLYKEACLLAEEEIHFEDRLDTCNDTPVTLIVKGKEKHMTAQSAHDWLCKNYVNKEIKID